jgi:hypothetical protein
MPGSIAEAGARRRRRRRPTALGRERPNASTTKVMTAARRAREWAGDAASDVKHKWPIRSGTRRAGAWAGGAASRGDDGHAAGRLGRLAAAAFQAGHDGPLESAPRQGGFRNAGHHSQPVHPPPFGSRRCGQVVGGA